MPEQRRGFSKFWGVALLISVGVLAWFAKPTTLKFGANILKDLPTMFGYFVLISLFIERAIEVFLSAWRSSGADNLDRQMANINKRITDRTVTAEGQTAAVLSDPAEIEQLKDKLESLELDRTQYRADSRFISQWLGLGIGVLIALVGVRVLGNIVDASSLTGSQVEIFIIVDIMLTGAVLAGGSEAINKIMKVYNSFMTSTADKAKS